MKKIKKITIDGEVCVPKDSVRLAEVDELPYAIVRCHDAGVHAGYIKEHKTGTREVLLVNSRRLWRWWSTGSLSALAIYGPHADHIDECRFAVVLPNLLVSDMCEIIYCTPIAKKAIEGVPEWKK
jgi:hypothetical protein